MSIYTDKVLLFISGGDLITASFVNSILSEGGKQGAYPWRERDGGAGAS